LSFDVAQDGPATQVSTGVSIPERVVCGVAKRFRQRPVERSRGPASWAYGDCSWGLAGRTLRIGLLLDRETRLNGAGETSLGHAAGGDGMLIAG
jgi:hypothetical protein